MDDKQIVNFVGYLNECFSDIKTKNELLLIRDLLTDVGKTRKIDKQFHHLLFSIIDQDRTNSAASITNLIEDYLNGNLEGLSKIIRLRNGQVPIKEELFCLIERRLTEEINRRPDDQTVVITSDLVTVDIPEGFIFDGIKENLLKQLEISVETWLDIKDKVRDQKVQLTPDLADNLESIISIWKLQMRQKDLQEKHATAVHSIDMEVRGEIIAQIQSDQDEFNKLLELSDSRLKAASHYQKKEEFMNAIISYKMANQTLIKGLSLSQRRQVGSEYDCKRGISTALLGISICLKSLADLKLYRETLEEYRIVYMETQHRTIKRELWQIEADLLCKSYGTNCFQFDAQGIIEGNTIEDFTDNILLPVISVRCSEFKGNYEINSRRRAELSSEIFLDFAATFFKNSSAYDLCQYYHRAIRQQKIYDPSLALGKIYDRYIENWNKIYWGLYSEIVKTPVSKRKNEQKLLEHMEAKARLKIGVEIKNYRDIIDTFSRLTNDIDVSFNVEDYAEDGHHSINSLIKNLDKCIFYVSVVRQYISKLTKDVIEDYIKNFSNMMFRIFSETVDTSKILFNQCDFNVTKVAKIFKELCRLYTEVLGKVMKPPAQFFSMQFEYYLLYSDCMRQMGYHQRVLPNLEYILSIDNNPEIKHKISMCKKLCQQIEEKQDTIEKVEKRIVQMGEKIKRNKAKLEALQVGVIQLLQQGLDTNEKETRIAEIQVKIKTNEENIQKEIDQYPKV